MYLSARVYVADVMDQIVVQATVFKWDHRNSLVAEEYRFSAMVAGEGETTPSEWLKDALVAMIETL
jgi:hypothetical protein